MKNTKLMKLVSGLIILSFAVVSIGNSPLRLSQKGQSPAGTVPVLLAPQTRIEHKKPIAVVALGGNAFNEKTQPVMAEGVVDCLVAKGYGVVVPHGNGPQVGKLLKARPNVPLPTHVKTTQAQMGSELKGAIRDKLASRDIKSNITALITEVRVDPEDPSFKNPTKPIGEVSYTREDAERTSEVMGIPKEHVKPEKRKIGGEVREVFRPNVASPKPLEIMNIESIRRLLEKGEIVIAAGGGGVPVSIDGEGKKEELIGVIDKDRASAVLAKQLGADIFIILTEVQEVYADFGKKEQRALRHISVAQAKKLLAEGHFGEGSMKPKIEAVVDFVESTGNPAIITDPASLGDALSGISGTYILNDEEAKALGFVEYIEAEIRDIRSGIADITWQLYSAIAVKKMSPDERRAYLDTLTPEERAKLNDARHEVFLSDFSDDENPLPDDLRVALIKEEKKLRERMNESAQEHIFAVIALSKCGMAKYPLLKRKVDLLYYSFLGAAVEAAHDVFVWEKELEQTFFGFKMVERLERKLGETGVKRLAKKYNFKDELDDATANKILRYEEDEKIRKAVWMLFVERGEACAEMRIKFIAAQNRAIREISRRYGLHYENYHQFSLESQGFDYAAYGAMMDRFDSGIKLRREEALRSARAKLGETPLEPWNALWVNHEVYKEAEGYFTADVIAKAFHDTFAGLGFDTSKIRMDRNERSGRLEIKFPHPGMCDSVDPIDGDVRLLSSPGGGIMPAYVLLHEAGHAVHYLNCPRDAGALLCDTHVVTTETIANYMEQLMYDPEWLLENTNMPKELVARFLIATREEDFIGPRGLGSAIAVAHFDKTMYEVVELYHDAWFVYKAQYGDRSPAEVLTRLYWDSHSEKMGFPAKEELPEFYKLPRWAGIYHFLLTTAYMPIGYEYAETLDAQNKALIRKRFGGIVNKEAGRWLNDNYFRWGDIIPWQDIARLALGEGVNPEPRIREHQMTEEGIRAEVEAAAQRVEERRRAATRAQASQSLLAPGTRMKPATLRESALELYEEIMRAPGIRGRFPEDLLGLRDELYKALSAGIETELRDNPEADKEIWKIARKLARWHKPPQPELLAEIGKLILAGYGRARTWSEVPAAPKPPAAASNAFDRLLIVLLDLGTEGRLYDRITIIFNGPATADEVRLYTFKKELKERCGRLQALMREMLRDRNTERNWLADFKEDAGRMQDLLEAARQIIEPWDHLKLHRDEHFRERLENLKFVIGDAQEILKESLNLVEGTTEASDFDFSEALGEFLPTLIMPRIKIEFRLQEGPIIIKGSKGSLLAAVRDVARARAWEAKTTDGVPLKINISTEADAQYCYVKVTDNGETISETLKEKILSLDYALRDEQRKRGAPLAHARLIVRDHGGDITIEPNGSGGNTFVIKIPRAERPTSLEGSMVRENL